MVATFERADQGRRHAWKSQIQDLQFRDAFHWRRPTRRGGGDRGGNVRLTCRGRATPRRPMRLGSGGRRAPSRVRTVRPGGGEVRPIARGRACPTRVLAPGARRQGQLDGPPEGAGRDTVSGRSASVGDSHSRGAASRGPASSRSVSSTGVSVGSVPSRGAPRSLAGSGGTSARASASASSGSSGADRRVVLPLASLDGFDLGPVVDRCCEGAVGRRRLGAFGGFPDLRRVAVGGRRPYECPGRIRPSRPLPDRSMTPIRRLRSGRPPGLRRGRRPVQLPRSARIRGVRALRAGLRTRRPRAPRRRPA